MGTITFWREGSEALDMPDGRSEFENGQDSILCELWSVIEELEKTRNPDSNHGRAQLYILRRVVQEMTDGYEAKQDASK
jgi:hypothetical protein